MRKNVKNDKVIRAMAIGISAMLATSSPMTAMAAEGTPDTDGDDNTSVVLPEEGVAEQVQAASDAVDTAQDSAATVKDSVKENVTEENDLAKAVIDAADNVENTEKGTPLADAGTAIENTNTQLEAAKANDELSDTEYGKAENAAKDASDAAEELNGDMQEAEQKVDGQLDKIENATTVAEANAAYAELSETAQTAQADFNAKLEEYNTAKAAYDEAAAKVAEYEKAYNEAIGNAETNAADAAKALEEAKANADALETALNVAKAAVDDSAKEAMAIAEAEKVAQEDGSLNWRNEDKLFIAIMENYYLPEKLDITGATVTRVQGKDNNEYNYFKAVYKDENGDERIKYFNYKMDGNSKDDIVIFEKREVEIFGGEADQYVDDDGKIVDTAAGLEDGSVVKVGDDFVQKNDLTDSETLVSNSEITGTSKEDVTIKDDTKQESYQLDEDGNLIKTITGDVTTITYTDATFTSDQSYATDAERDAAAAKKEAELEETTGKDATVKETEKTTYTYTANGTYIPTFTKTVNVNEEVEWKHTNKKTDLGVKTEAEAVAKVQKAEEKKLKDDGLYLIGIQSDLSVTGYTEDKRYDDSDFIVTGTVTATYAKVTKKTVSQSTFGSLWNDIKALFGSGQATNEKLEAAAKAAVEAEGGIFVSANWNDWKYNKATISYVAGVKVTTDEKQTEQAAKNAVKSTALQQAQANGATGVYNVKTNSVDTVAHTTYSYTVDYLEKATETTENKVIATETYGNADVLEGQIIQNKNYVDGNILLTQKNEEYRAFVDSAKNLTAKYNDLLEKALQAKKDVVAAQKAVGELQTEISNLKDRQSNLDALKELETELTVAETNKKAAEDTLKDILAKLETAGRTWGEVVDSLTPASETSTAGIAEGGAEIVEAGDVTVTTTPTVLAAARTAVARTATITPAAVEDTVDIADEEVPLGAEEEDEKENVQIADEEVPLAGGVVEDEQNQMSWWWLLIVAILGATGYEMYRKHNQKKQKVVVENTKETK